MRYQNIDFDLRREGLRVTTVNVNEPFTTAREMADVLERIVGTATRRLAADAG